MPNYEVIHEEAEGRFVATVSGEESYVLYRMRDDETIVFEHTYTPTSLRGRGIAGYVVHRALEFARENNLTVIPHCWYVSAFIDRHPEYQGLLSRHDH